MRINKFIPIISLGVSATFLYMYMNKDKSNPLKLSSGGSVGSGSPIPQNAYIQPLPTTTSDKKISVTQDTQTFTPSSSSSSRSSTSSRGASSSVAINKTPAPKTYDKPLGPIIPYALRQQRAEERTKIEQREETISRVSNRVIDSVSRISPVTYVARETYKKISSWWRS